MKQLLYIICFLLVSCSTKEKLTIIYVSPSDFISNELIKNCDNPTKAAVWMELTEHSHFKCTNYVFYGDYTCYGWKIDAKVRCKINNTEQILIEENIAFGNTNIHEKQ